MAITGVTPVSTVGSKNVWPRAWLLPPASTSAPRAVRVRDMPLDLLEPLLVDERPDLGAVVDSRGDPEGSRGGCEPLGEHVVDGSWTSIRLAEMQVWPEFRNLQKRAPATASSRSASSKTMNGALPPSSSDTFLTCCAHCSMSSFPTAVEPVNPSFRTTGFEVSSPPISGAPAASP